MGMRRIFVLALHSSLLWCAQSTVTLAPVPSPSAGQAGVTTVNLTGSGFPSGTIAAANVTVTLQPSAPGGGPTGTTAGSAVRMAAPGTDVVSFAVPSSILVASPASYQISIAGSTSTGATFASGNTTPFTVNPPAQIASVAPPSAGPGHTAQVTITGLYTQFFQGSTQAGFGPGVSVGGSPAGQLGHVTVTSPTSATAQLTIAASATVGTQSVTVVTGLQQATLQNGFTVGPAPMLTLTPGSGPPTSGIAASGTGFVASETVDLYFDSTLVAQTMADATGAFAAVPVTVPAQATPGSHTLKGVGQQSGIAAQANFLVQTNWLEFRFDPQRDGYNPFENVLNASNVGGLQVLWTLPTANYLDGEADFVDGVIYMGTDGKNPLLKHHPVGTPAPTMFAINPLNGKIIWQTQVPFNLDSTAAVANGMIYDAEFNGGLDAFDTVTGKVLWSASTGGATGYSSPDVVDGVVYVGSLDNQLYAFDAATGAQIWATPTSGQIFGSPTVVNGVVYIGSGDNSVYAFNATTGEQIWSFPTGGQIFASPAVVNGVLYIGSEDGNLYAVNAATGQQVWSAPAGNMVKSSAAVANGVVYVGSYDHRLYAFDATTGQQLWKALTGGEILSSPAVANGVVYVGSIDSSVYAFDASTGAQLFSFATGDTIVGSPTVVNGVLYICSRDKTFYALALP